MLKNHMNSNGTVRILHSNNQYTAPSNAREIDE